VRVSECVSYMFMSASTNILDAHSDITTFGLFVLIDIAEVSALQEFYLKAIHYATMQTGLSQTAVIIIACAVLVFLLIIVVLSCWYVMSTSCARFISLVDSVIRERRRSRRRVRSDEGLSLTASTCGVCGVCTTCVAVGRITARASIADVSTVRRQSRRRHCVQRDAWTLVEHAAVVASFVC
jgi:hypothetical protein